MKIFTSDMERLILQDLHDPSNLLLNIPLRYISITTLTAVIFTYVCICVFVYTYSLPLYYITNISITTLTAVIFMYVCICVFVYVRILFPCAI